MNAQKCSAKNGVSIVALLLGLLLLSSDLYAAPKTSSLNIIPTITSITLVDGQLVASGVATANIKGRVYTAPFTNVPIDISLAPNQTNAPAGCPILNLELGPIELDLLGLVVETSPICLVITAVPGGGLLGDLLCNIANLLDAGLPLDQILGLLNQVQLNNLTTGLTNLLNQVLPNLLNAVLTDILQGGGPRECAILNLALGPVNLNLLGLNVVLDNCSNGPVTVDITGRRGALLGNVLCNLLGRNQIPLGSLLDAILDRLLARGPL